MTAEDFHGHDVVVGGDFVVWLNALKGPQIGYRIGLAYRDTVDMQHFEYTERVLEHGVVGVEEFEDGWCPVVSQENLYDMECLVGEDQEMPSEDVICLLRMAWAKDIKIAIQELPGWEDYGDAD